MPYTPYFEQQWYGCGMNNQGELSNLTKTLMIARDQLDFQEQLLSAATTQALRVQSEIDNLAGCICVYPNDTTTYAFGMIPRSPSLVYGQNFKSPFLIYGSTEYPLLTDALLDGLSGE